MARLKQRESTKSKGDRKENYGSIVLNKTRASTGSPKPASEYVYVYNEM